MKRLRYFSFFCLVILVGWALSGVLPVQAFNPPASAAASYATPTDHPIITPMNDGLEISWSLPHPQTAQQPDGSVTVSIGSLPLLQDPGQPRLPVFRGLVAIPEGAVPWVELHGVDSSPLALPGPLAVNAVETESFSPPQDWVQIEALGVMRGLHLARLTIAPVLLQGDQVNILHAVTATVHFGAPAAAPQAPGSDELGQTEADPLTEEIRAALLNPTQAQPVFPNPNSEEPASSTAGEAMPAANETMPGEESPSSSADPTNPAEAPSPTPQELLPSDQLAEPAAAAAPRAILEVTGEGITEITYSALAAAGFPLSGVNPANLHLLHGGSQVAMDWQGDGDAQFESGERLLFFASPRFNRWMAGDTYLLTTSNQPGLRVASQAAGATGAPVSAALVQQTFEENKIYTPDCNCAPIPAGRDGDRWVWDQIRSPDLLDRSYGFSLSDVNSASTAKLTFWLIGYTNVPATPDHKLNVYVNGHSAGSVSFDGKQAANFTIDLPGGWLAVGNNTLRLVLQDTDPVNGLWLDAFQVRYSRTSAAVGSALVFDGAASGNQRYTVNFSSAAGLLAYDVSQPETPLLLSNVQVSGASVSLTDPSERQHRYALAAAAGIRTPSRIRMAAALPTASGADLLIISPSEFLTSIQPLVTYRQNQGIRTVVANVQAVYDAKEGIPDPDAIRDYIATAYAGWSPRPRYVLLVGDGTSDPRRYVNTSSQTYIPPYLADVDPISGETAADNRYAAVDGADTLPDLMLGRLPVNSSAELDLVVQKLIQYDQGLASVKNLNRVIVSDNPDSAGNFSVEAQEMVGVPGGPNGRWTAQPFDSTRTTEKAFRAAVMSTWQSGANLMIYVGHSSIHQWGAERFFHLDDVSKLTNAPRLPVLLEMTCLTGAFQTPNLPTLDESLLRKTGGGVVAVWGSSGFSFTSSHTLLAQGFLQATAGRSTYRLGSAVANGQRSLIQQSDQADRLLDEFVMLGDPAMQAASPPVYGVFVPVVRR
jgi:hypothetical protein